MSTIHHFGDSYGEIDYLLEDYPLKDYPLHFVELCSKKLKKKYKNHSVSGYSNEFILKKIIEKMDTFKKNDIVFIQFSYFCRGAWYNDMNKQIENTNTLYDEINRIYYGGDNTVQHLKKVNNNEKLLSLVNYYLKYTEDYARRIFDIINIIIKQLITMGICVFFIHIDDDIYADSLLNSGYNIKFEKGFGKWLQLNKFHNEEEGHYTKNIQTMLSDIIMSVTNDLKIDTNFGNSDIIKLSNRSFI
jgi:hypothetical protein